MHIVELQGESLDVADGEVVTTDLGRGVTLAATTFVGDAAARNRIIVGSQFIERTTGVLLEAARHDSLVLIAVSI